MKKHLLTIAIILISISNNLYSDEVADFMNKGLKYNISEDGKNFAKFGFATQIWARYTELNPVGVFDDAGNEITSDFDILLRRNFFNAFVKFDKFTFFTMVAMTTQPVNISVSPFADKKQSLYLYDAWGAYEVIPKYLRIGGGLSMYGGASRYYSCSSAATLGVDVPLVSAPNLLTDDQSARKMGIFAVGQLGILDYRINITKPFLTQTAIIDSNVAKDMRDYNLAYNARFSLQFLDRENPIMPFYPATYLGKKSIFNIGLGFSYHPQSTFVGTTEDMIVNDKLHIALDYFYEKPMESGGVLTQYLGYFYYDFGKNYLMNFGVASIWGKEAIAEPQHGTGRIIYGQLAYLFANSAKEAGKIQVFGTYAYKSFEAVVGDYWQFSGGLNYYAFGHKTKFTLEWMNRPYIVDNTVDSYKNAIIGKMQIQI